MRTKLQILGTSKPVCLQISNTPNLHDPAIYKLRETFSSTGSSSLYLFRLPVLEQVARSNSGKSRRMLRTASHYRSTGVDMAVSRGGGAASGCIPDGSSFAARPSSARVCTSETERPVGTVTGVYLLRR